MRLIAYSPPCCSFCPRAPKVMVLSRGSYGVAFACARHERELRRRVDGLSAGKLANVEALLRGVVSPSSGAAFTPRRSRARPPAKLNVNQLGLMRIARSEGGWVHVRAGACKTAEALARFGLGKYHPRNHSRSTLSGGGRPRFELTDAGRERLSIEELRVAP